MLIMRRMVDGLVGSCRRRGVILQIRRRRICGRKALIFWDCIAEGDHRSCGNTACKIPLGRCGRGLIVCGGGVFDFRS